MAAENSFRSQLSGFRWAQGSTDDSRSGAAEADTNPFSRFTSSISAAIPLRSNARTNEEEAYVCPSCLPSSHTQLTLSRWERFIGFLACTVGAALCFGVAFLTLFVFNYRKFAIAFSLGSLLFMAGFGILMGPLAFVKHLVGPERLPFTATYLGSLALTLYFALGLHSYLGAIIAGLIQVGALVSFLFAYFPGGTTTLRFGASMAMRGAGSLLPV